MRTRCAALAMMCAAVAQTASAGQATQAGFVHASAPLPANSTVFAVRDPLPGHLGYLQAIRFIDDRMKYRDPLSAFFVSPAGEPCFRTFPNDVHVIYDGFYSDWCVYPQTVSSIRPIANMITNRNKLILSCAHALPQCVRRHAYPFLPGYVDPAANSITVPTVAYRDQAAVLLDLIYVMGGNPAAIRGSLSAPDSPIPLIER